jgi:hypothetical protein
MAMRPGDRPYAWFSHLIEAAKAAFEFIVDRQSLPGPQISSWVKDGDVYAPVATLTWSTGDGLSRNLHVALVAADEGAYDDDHVSGEAVIQANAWLDAVGRQGEVSRRAVNKDIDRLENLSKDALDRHANDIQIALWQAYGVISRVDRETLEGRPVERASGQGDPGPLRLEVWRDQ